MSQTQLQKKYSWSNLMSLAEKEETTADKVINLLSQASEEDRKKILDFYSNILGSDYSKDMTENYEPSGKKVKSDLDIFREIFASWDENSLMSQYQLLSTAMEDEEEEEGDDEDQSENDEDEKEEKEEKEDDEEDEDENIKDSSFDQLMRVIASWEPKDRKAVYEIFKNLLGSEYSNDTVRDYNPRGKARDTSKPQSSGQLEDKGASKVDGAVNEKTDSSTTDASSKRTIKTASKDDRNQIEKLFKGLLGANFANKLTEVYQNKNGKTVSQTGQTSGQTKTSSFDPWGLKKK